MNLEDQIMLPIWATANLRKVLRWEHSEAINHE